MKETSPELVLLFDLYGAMLTDKQHELFDLYHNEDLSLAEIAENQGITRQGVRDAIIRAENLLRDMEARLGLQRRYGRMDAELEKISQAVQKAKHINATGLLSAALDECLRDIDVALERLQD